MSYIGSKPANKPVVASDLDPTVITGQTALATSPADTDEFLISDAGVLKRLDASLIGSQDYVKLSSTTPSAANTFSIDGHFTADYDIYKIYVIGVSGASMSNTRFSMRVNVGGTAQTGTNHYYMGYLFQNGGSNIGWSNSTGQGHSDIGYVHSSSGSTAQGNLEMTIYRPLATDKTAINSEMIGWDNGTTLLKAFNHTVWNVATAISGITLGVGAFGTGNIEADRILVYGLKI